MVNPKAEILNEIKKVTKELQKLYPQQTFFWGHIGIFVLENDLFNVSTKIGGFSFNT